MTKITWLAIAASIASAAILAGCTAETPAPTGGGSDPTANSATEGALPAGLLLAKAPEGAMPLAEMKSSKEKGDTVTFVARIGGREEPFIAGRAMMLVVDSSLESCAELHGDACETPWDYCCEEPDSLLASTATVQVVGEDGKPLPLALEGQLGIEELVTVTIVGTVASKDEGGSMVVTATGIHVQPKS